MCECMDGWVNGWVGDWLTDITNNLVFRDSTRLKYDNTNVMLDGRVSQSVRHAKRERLNILYFYFILDVKLLFIYFLLSISYISFTLVHIHAPLSVVRQHC